MNNYKSLMLILFFLFGIFSFTNVWAVDVNANTVDLMQLEFFKAVRDWYAPLAEIARWLLLSLAGLSFVWMGIQLLLKGADLQEMVAELVRFVVVVGLALWLIDNAKSISDSVLDGWIWIGGEANTGAVSSPGGIFELGLDIYGQILESSEGMGAKIVNGIIGIVVLILYSLITVMVFLVEVEVMVVTAAGVILLGFMGNPWTGNYAHNYLRYWLSSGIKLYVLYLVVGAGERFVSAWASSRTYGDAIGTGELIGISIILLGLVIKIPEMVQSLVNGSGGSMPTVGRVASTAASVAAGGAVGAAGGAMAIREATKMAGEQGASGFGGMAAQTSKNLVSAGAAVAAGKVMGGYKASHGSFGGSMAQSMRAAHDAALKSAGVPGGAMSGADVLRQARSGMQGIDVAGDLTPSHGSIGGNNQPFGGDPVVPQKNEDKA